MPPEGFAAQILFGRASPRFKNEAGTHPLMPSPGLEPGPTVPKTVIVSIQLRGQVLLASHRICYCARPNEATGAKIVNYLPLFYQENCPSASSGQS